jgi:hypothetical protein
LKRNIADCNKQIAERNTLLEKRRLMEDPVKLEAAAREAMQQHIGAYRKESKFRKEVRRTLKGRPEFRPMIKKILARQPKYAAVQAIAHTGPASKFMDIPLAELEQIIATDNAITQAQKRDLETKLQEADTMIVQIDENFERTRQYLQNMYNRAEERRQAHEETVILWAAQDAEHLRRLLTETPSLANAATTAYQKRHPEDNLAWLPGPTTSNGHSTAPSNHRRRKKKAAQDQPQQTAVTEQPWQFIAVTHEHDQGQVMSAEKTEFLPAMQQFLSDRGQHNIDAALVHKKLTAITKLDADQRRKIKRFVRVAGWNFNSWAQWPIASDYRMRIAINEEKRLIRFFLYQKNEVQRVLK